MEKQAERPDGLQVCDIANAIGTDATSIEYDFLRSLRFPLDVKYLNYAGKHSKD